MDPSAQAVVVGHVGDGGGGGDGCVGCLGLLLAAREAGQLLQHLDLPVHHSQHAAVEGPLLGQLLAQLVVQDGQLL